MFVLSEIQDLVRIPPHTFNTPIHHAINDELHKKYANKVISNLGLVVSVWDLLDINDGMLKPGDGASFVDVKFRCIVWKPFMGEILTGWVKECTAEGIKPVELAWVWKADEENELYIESNEKIRFRIEEEIFANIKPKSSVEASGIEEPKNKTPPYAIVASCQAEGMGCVSWWD
ncbi:hypothetical protein QCA50_018358 [Cerrena zonata]|uniref:DNA-directed RNA polymerase III subunit RPC8 n=1 Tax=Cerrena zonata TaxID=2478898 RepID=A0AAW0FM14_9APHY